MAQTLLKKQEQCLFCHHTVFSVFKMHRAPITIFFEEKFTHRPRVSNAADTLIQGWWDFSQAMSLWWQLDPGLNSWFWGCSSSPLYKQQQWLCSCPEVTQCWRASVFSLPRRLKHHVVLELQPQALTRDRLLSADVLISTLLFWTLLPYKRSNQLSCKRTKLCIIAAFFTSKSLHKH